MANIKNLRVNETGSERLPRDVICGFPANCSAFLLLNMHLPRSPYPPQHVETILKFLCCFCYHVFTVEYFSGFQNFLLQYLQLNLPVHHNHGVFPWLLFSFPTTLIWGQRHWKKNTTDVFLMYICFKVNSCSCPISQ